MISPTRSLVGHTAVVTGSSSGIGRAIALEFARAGADVIVHARRNQRGAEETAAAIEAIGCEATVLMGDLSATDGQDELVQDAYAWRAPHIWVNNAGADVLTGVAADWSFEKKLAALWNVDVVATLRLSRAVGERMRERGQGVILNIGWDQANTGMAGDSGQMFAAIKGAVMAATASLAKSFAPEVRVNCIAPGWIRTDWGHDASEKWQKIATGDSLLGRWGEPEDIARLALFLASSQSEFINGQIINVNGGRNDSKDTNW